MLVTIAIDPGSEHVGWAQDTAGEVTAGEIGNDVAAAWLDERLAFILAAGSVFRGMTSDDIEVVIEAYVLYPGQDRKNVWNPLRTSELIGALKLVCLHHDVRWIEQGANIKKPTRRQLRARRNKQTGRGTHARDAELHLYYRTLRRKEGRASGKVT